VVVSDLTVYEMCWYCMFVVVHLSMKLYWPRLSLHLTLPPRHHRWGYLAPPHPPLSVHLAIDQTGRFIEFMLWAMQRMFVSASTALYVPNSRFAQFHYQTHITCIQHLFWGRIYKTTRVFAKRGSNTKHTENTRRALPKATEYAR
jgi:hypothetical protein